MGQIHLAEGTCKRSNIICSHKMWRAGQRSRYSDWLRAGRPGNQIPVGSRFSVPVQAGPGAHPASCTMVTGSFQGGKELPWHDADPSPPSSAVGHKRVELYLYSPYGPYGLYRASVLVQGCTLLYLTIKYEKLCDQLGDNIYFTRRTQSRFLLCVKS